MSDLRSIKGQEIESLGWGPLSISFSAFHAFIKAHHPQRFPVFKIETSETVGASAENGAMNHAGREWV